MKITIYELLGLIKDGKAPEKIKYQDYCWEWTGDDYETRKFGVQKFLITGQEYTWVTDFLKDEVEILDDKFIKEQREHKKQLLNKLAKNYNLKVIEEVEDKEYEDIEEVDVEYDNDGKLSRTINALIRNQKYILERLDKNE